MALAVCLVAPLTRAQTLASPEIEARREHLRDTTGRDSTTETARALIRLAEGAEGELLPDVARALAPLGDRAVPALIEARAASPSPATRAWAADELELIGKRTPGDAVQTDDRAVLCDVLRAYGAANDIDALPAVLAFVGADRSDVRQAARASVLAYGDRALRRLRDAYAAHTGARPPAELDADAVAHALFDACDAERLRQVEAMFERGLTAQRNGNLRDAVAAFDEAIAQQPNLSRMAEAGPAYVAYATSIAADRDSATLYLRKALRVDPVGASANQARSVLAVLEGRDLRGRGLSDATPFTRALALDPGNGAAKAELALIRAQGDAARSAARHLAMAAIAIGVTLASIAGLAARRIARRRNQTLDGLHRSR
jgi:tetratricopeptide (TPR) repeat protein